ncbi:hypothetical protein [Streptomyces sp. MH60]|uniref:hypothetical protein n=1 Tax=Streptomyces sp. MH60 TaxID=1940758 RepID=UPI000D47E6F8|nr:hypothetical protein [Streptomyces sp. MH60]PPS90963.1 hypothetical protein BZZ08_00561 [Streptomyces sp. MH60]
MADEQLERLATQAWLYGCPPVPAAVTKDVMTAVAPRDDERRKAPVNQFCYMRHTPDATFTEVVSRTPTPCTSVPGWTSRRNRWS